MNLLTLLSFIVLSVRCEDSPDSVDSLEIKTQVVNQQIKNLKDCENRLKTSPADICDGYLEALVKGLEDLSSKIMSPEQANHFSETLETRLNLAHHSMESKKELNE